MAGSNKSPGIRFHICILFYVWLMLFFLFLPSSANSSINLEKMTGVYFPSSCLYGRSFDGIIHYMKAAGLNLAVLHVKDPNGRLFWDSSNTTAVYIGAPSNRTSLENTIHILKQKGIWTAAKLDVFQDSLLVIHHPEMGVVDSKTSKLWADKKGLHWANPYDRRVWDYTIALCLELIDLGIDEIQFDYVRFPSDGDLSSIEYPVILEGVSPADCIGKFLAYANSKLKPKGTTISVDLFGLTAWKTEDFGVGQVLEKIAPHVDVICPMLYPSHFPHNFLSLKNPGQYPYRIIKLSLEEMKKRTKKEIRPWIQGFWYTPSEINAQLKGVTDCNLQSWTVWNPTGKYGKTFNALEIQGGIQFPGPEFYPPLDELRNRADLVAAGRTKIVNHTCYSEGYSIISLDETVDGEKAEYTTIIDVVSTLDEGIIDQILSHRGLAFSQWTSRYTKSMHITNLIIQDLHADPRRMRPSPIYVDWDSKNIFTRSIPPERLEHYQNHVEELKTVISGSQR
jgi:hypothetical protein